MKITIDNRTPLLSLEWKPEYNIRKAIVANALACIDVSVADPRTRRIMEDLLGPIGGKWDLDRPFRVWKENGKYKTQGISTCGLVAEGLWRRVGVLAPWLTQEYAPKREVEKALTRAVQHGHDNKAWRTPDARSGARVPVPGDLVIIGQDLNTHALTCVGWDGDTLISVDGGQVGARGLQAIHLCKRPYNRGNLGVRAIQGWVDPTVLAYEGTMLVPEGWEDVVV